jgi:hypothetical protein
MKMENIKKNNYAFEEIYKAYVDISLKEFDTIKKNRCNVCNVILNTTKKHCGSQMCKEKYYLKKYGVKSK